MNIFRRLYRAYEVYHCIGWDWDIVRTVFPPYRGFDIGCEYCAYHEDAMKAGRCELGKEYGWKKCGRTSKD
jgi:hypothetical protein